MKVRNFLKKFGLTEVEIDIYLTLLESGPNSVLDISKKTKIKRSTVHINVDSLIEKGLLSQTKEGTRRKLVAEPPEHLGVLLEQKKVFFETLDKELIDIIGFLRKTIDLDKSSGKVDVSYYTGREAIARIYDEILKADEVRAYVDSNDIAKVFPENFDKFLKSAKSGRIEIWDMQRVTPEGKKFKEEVSRLGIKNYHIKYFPLDTEVQQMDYLIYSNKITIVQGGKIPSAILINNELIYKNAKVIFDLLWKNLP